MAGSQRATPSAGGAAAVHAAHLVHKKLNCWSNGSGNYRPHSDHAYQAAMPMEGFYLRASAEGANKQ
jgi:hypothetical protein